MNLPGEITRRVQWLAYRIEPAKDGRTTKIPYRATGGGRASATDPATWTDFETALANGRRFDGIGFVFTADDPFVGIDLDKCRDLATGELTPQAQGIVNALDSYTEISPSGAGLHIICKGRLPEGGRRKDGVEMYSEGRYFTMSGNHFPGTPHEVFDRTAELAALHARLFAKPEAARPVPAAGFAFLPDDAALLEKARSAKNGGEFTALFDNGDLSAYGSDESRADLALCKQLLFWTGGDAERAERLFNQSALGQRDKWQRGDYRRRTFDKAAANLTKVYSPRPSRLRPERKAGPAPRRQDAETPDTATVDNPAPSASEEPKAVENDADSIPALADAILSEDHFAQDGAGVLYVFAGGVYAPEGEKRVKKRVKALLEKAGLSDKWSSHKASEVCKYICVDAPLLWDAPPLDTVNVLNGLLDVNRRELRPHDTAFLSTVQIPVRYDPAADCPHWKEFIRTSFSDDTQELAFEVAAWLLTPDISIQKAVLCLGEGSNGKSAWLTGVTAFLGKANVAALSLQKLEEDKFAAARLLGKLANICPDLPSKHLSETGTFKALTGTEAQIHGEIKFKDSFEFVPTARLLFSANQPPRSGDATHAFYRRWLVVPFGRTFEEGTAFVPIPRHILDARLADPQELSGVLNHALALLPRLRKQGFTETASMRHAWNEFRQETDPLAVWLDRETVAEPEAITPRHIVRDTFAADCRQRGQTPLSGTNFGLAIKRLRPGLHEAQRTFSGKVTWCYIGLRLREEDETPSHPSQGSQGLSNCIPLETNPLPESEKQESISTIGNNSKTPVKSVNPVNVSSLKIKATQTQKEMASLVAKRRVEANDATRKANQDAGEEGNYSRDYYGALAEIVVRQFLETKGVIDAAALVSNRPDKRPDLILHGVRVEVKASRPKYDSLAINQEQHDTRRPAPDYYLPCLFDSTGEHLSVMFPIPHADVSRWPMATGKNGSRFYHAPRATLTNPRSLPELLEGLNTAERERTRPNSAAPPLATTEESHATLAAMMR